MVWDGDDGFHGVNTDITDGPQERDSTLALGRTA
jgi:hypothetical protein